MMIVDRIALTLVVIGAINWGSIGVFGFDTASCFSAVIHSLKQIKYTLTGLAGIWSISLLFKEQNEDNVEVVRR